MVHDKRAGKVVRLRILRGLPAALRLTSHYLGTLRGFKSRSLMNLAVFVERYRDV
jgi:hypothetical protein